MLLVNSSHTILLIHIISLLEAKYSIFLAAKLHFLCSALMQLVIEIKL